MMQESSSALPPEGSGRRGLFPRRAVSPSESPPSQPVVVLSLDRAVEERLEEGLQAIEEQAAALMREIAAEMWRASGGDIGEAQDRILSFLSRDQAIKSLIASSDERFQTLAVRTARFEDILTELAASTRATRESISEGALAMREVADSPAIHSVDRIRSQLELVENHIAAAFAHLDERDKSLIDGIESRIQEHGELIARETTRIVEAMQGYVQTGAETVGRLAQRVETHAEAFAVHDDDLSESLRSVTRQEIGDFVEQFELTGERIGIGQRDAEHLLGRLQAALEARVYGLAQLVRSDSQALRRHVDESTNSQEELFLGAIREIASAQEDRVLAAIDGRLDALARTGAEQLAALTDAIAATVDRQAATLADGVQERLALVTEQVAQRAAEAADIAVTSTFDQTLERLTGSIDAIESIRSAQQETSASLEERLAGHVDDAITGLAKLMRADNRVIAEHLAAGDGGETNRQTLRALKELQAGLSGDILRTVDRRFDVLADQLHRESQSTVETMAKVAEVIADKVDRMSARIDEAGGGDLQIVVERMSEAISTLSGMGPQRRQPRIDLE